ncbi:hypothetical protein E2C01_092428 [Portunus trituberculatus]|uniref:Uncharacterized protein n=1 Tax=Portunus trituberculatus TaxID=210409 RepID=A0A5B7JXR7_PORTR|nr:hypothetical protein [Portunus trituberculatus]
MIFVFPSSQSRRCFLAPPVPEVGAAMLSVSGVPVGPRSLLNATSHNKPLETVLYFACHGCEGRRGTDTSAGILKHFHPHPDYCRKTV